jgi:AraC-like DNA-binding protein
MGRAFIKRLGVTPSQYRDKFEVKDAGKSPVSQPHYAVGDGSFAASAPP